mgnify:CR=1 FL=1
MKDKNYINPWILLNPTIKDKEYLCKMDTGYIKMCHWTGEKWLDMWKDSLEGNIREWTLLPDELINTSITHTKSEDYIEVAERLYYHVNPGTKMDVPNSAYITTEKWYREWLQINTELDLFDWCIKNKQ